MSKLPRYMKLKHEGNFNYTLIIKKWGIPFLLFKAIKKNYEFKWYHWFTLYPYVCLRIMFGGVDNV